MNILVNRAVDTDCVLLGTDEVLVEDQDGSTHAELEVGGALRLASQSARLQVVTPDDLIHVDGILHLEFSLEVDKEPPSKKKKKKSKQIYNYCISHVTTTRMHAVWSHDCDQWSPILPQHIEHSQLHGAMLTLKHVPHCRMINHSTIMSHDKHHCARVLCSVTTKHCVA